MGKILRSSGDIALRALLTEAREAVGLSRGSYMSASAVVGCAAEFGSGLAQVLWAQAQVREVALGRAGGGEKSAQERRTIFFCSFLFLVFISNLKFQTRI